MRLAILLSLSMALGLQAASPAEANLEVVHRIKTEAFDHSKVMEQLAFLTDLYGPRLTASPEFQQAADWAMSRLKEYGVSNVHGEKWGPFGRSWSLQTYSLEMTAPRYSHLVGAPLAWSAPTSGPLSGDVLLAPIIPAGNRFDLKAAKEALQKYEAEWKGKLKGKIVLISEADAPKPTTNPLFHRYTDAELAEIAKAPEPAQKLNITSIDELKIPRAEEDARKYFQSLPTALVDQYFDAREGLRAEEGKFFHDEGALALIRADARAHNGLLFAE